MNTKDIDHNKAIIKVINFVLQDLKESKGFLDKNCAWTVTGFEFNYLKHKHGVIVKLHNEDKTRFNETYHRSSRYARRYIKSNRYTCFMDIYIHPTVPVEYVTCILTIPEHENENF